MHQATHVTGIRRAGYLGLAKTRLEHLAAATAINVIRLDAWYNSRPLDRTRTVHSSEPTWHPQHERGLALPHRCQDGSDTYPGYYGHFEL